jgi:hypothetical protein
VQDTDRTKSAPTSGVSVDDGALSAAAAAAAAATHTLDALLPRYFDVGASERGEAVRGERAIGWRYRADVAHTLSHGAGVTCLAVSPDESCFLTGGEMNVCAHVFVFLVLFC